MLFRSSKTTKKAYQNIKVLEEFFDDVVESVSGEVGDEGVGQVHGQPPLLPHGHAEVPGLDCKLCEVSFEAEIRIKLLERWSNLGKGKEKKIVR